MSSGRRSRGRRALRLLSYAVLALVAVFVLAPFAFMISTSVKPADEIYAVPIRWIPARPTLANYRQAFAEIDILRGTWNTLLIAVPSTLGGLLTASFAGYAFAKLRFPGRDAIFAALLSTMMLPSVVTLIPQFVGFARIGWIDTYYPLIVPGAAGSAVAIFLMRQYFASIPDELIEAATLDGANPFQTFTRVVFPLAGPAVATLAVLGLKAAWNDYFGPLIYITSPQKMNIQQMIAGTQNAYGGEPAVLMAGASLAMLPLVVLFLFAQRYFVEGLARTGLKR
ncbi:carbohydrate ABC transporter permease [Sorangium sp. So ce367]|uniref:carbohydrate ABC transporter permease n=1 Tax=Sorangium sp. So ce367 TaxID=3133305 RepID=UPI003F628D3A